jgi:radical SAM protein with 4Fe4S-binding SPASM domain
MLGLKKKGVNVYIANALPFCVVGRRIYRPLLRGAYFDDGYSRVVLDSRGFFKPSYFLEENLGKTLREAWGHPFMRKMRQKKNIPLSCCNCFYVTLCLGGSRFLAQKTSGTYSAPDPLS